jgi:UDP-N-acetylmuramoyl-tripeptide--D-alanyl-D-alanine ligase
MNRVEWRDTGKNKVLLDAYNANPTSMSLSIDNFAKWHNDGIMVLGDMFELGDEAAQEHEAIVQQVLDLGLDKQCILVGKLFQVTSWNGTGFETTAELLENWQQKGAPKGAHILLKGSRGIALEKLLPLL